jgi:hypothetical protein
MYDKCMYIRRSSVLQDFAVNDAFKRKLLRVPDTCRRYKTRADWIGIIWIIMDETLLCDHGRHVLTKTLGEPPLASCHLVVTEAHLCASKTDVTREK